MTELETMQRAKMYLDKLAQGIDPITGQALPEDTALNNVRLCRCFHYVSGILEQVIANGGQVGKRERSVEFSITRPQMAHIQLSQYPIGINEFAENIRAATGNPDMKRPNTGKIPRGWKSRACCPSRPTPRASSAVCPRSLASAPASAPKCAPARTASILQSATTPMSSE